jgi:hypothetical protein
MYILKILTLLASTKDEQIEYLINLGTSPSTDELALEFDDAYNIFLVNLCENDNFSINQKCLEMLNEIDVLFTDMSNNEINDFWNISSLNLKEWNCIRELSKQILEQMK